MPPARITNVIPTARMPFSATWRRMSVRFPASRKISSPRRTGENTHASTKTAINPTNGLNCPNLMSLVRLRVAAKPVLRDARFLVSDSCEFNNALLRRLRAGERAGEFSFAQHDDTVGQTKQFGKFRGGENDAETARREFLDQAVDFGLALDVNALRRLVQQQHFRIGQQPFRQHNLLLIASAQVDCRGAGVRRFDAELYNGLAHRLLLALL